MSKDFTETLFDNLQKEQLESTTEMANVKPLLQGEDSNPAIKTNGEILQRSSQRKKIRKTFGSDFLDLNLTQFAYSSKKPRISRNCFYCKGAGEMLPCKSCKCRAHVDCFRKNNGFVRKGYKNLNALCALCRSCDACNKSEGLFYYCSICNSPYHLGCDRNLNEMLIADFPKNWRCSFCDNIESQNSINSLSEGDQVKEVNRRKTTGQRQPLAKKTAKLDNQTANSSPVGSTSDLLENSSQEKSNDEKSPSNNFNQLNGEVDACSAIGIERLEPAPGGQNKNDEQQQKNLLVDSDDTKTMNLLEEKSVSGQESESDLLIATECAESIDEIGSSVEIGQDELLVVPEDPLTTTTTSVTEPTSPVVSTGEQSQDSLSLLIVDKKPFASDLNQNASVTNTTITTEPNTALIGSSHQQPLSEHLQQRVQSETEHQYACTITDLNGKENVRHSQAISSSVSQSKTSSLSSQGCSSDRSKKRVRSDSDRQMQKMQQQTMNKILCRTGATDSLKQKLFKRVCKSHLNLLTPSKWSVDDVVYYIQYIGFEKEAERFREEAVDGKSLMLLNRSDILNGFGIKLGPAIKMFAYIHDLQTKNRGFDQTAEI